MNRLSIWAASYAACIFLLFLGPISGDTCIAQPLADPEACSPYYQRSKDGGRIREETHYVTMDDGVRLAVNVYRPSRLRKGHKAPAILYMTRYWRAIGFRWPFKWFMKMVPSTGNFDPLDLVRYGYVLVTVDVRGTGASEGDKTLTLPDIREVLDSRTLTDWVVAQPWCDGNVGATGVSYIGNTALYALYNRHPALKAIVPTYSVWDLYDDVSAPGGIFYHDFLAQYADFCETLDQNIIPMHRQQRGAKLATYGVQRVRGTGPRRTRSIIAQHSCNVYHPDEGSTATFIDDTLTVDRSLYIRDVLSPHRFADRIRESGAAVYSWSGWRDAGFVHSAVRQYINLDNGRNMLRLGPWNHGGNRNISPTQWNRSRFDDIREVVRFFDLHLKGITHGADTLPRVHYYTMVEDRWKQARTWPPPSEPVTFFLGADGSATVGAAATEGAVPYQVDTARRSERSGRWDMESDVRGDSYVLTSHDDSICALFTTPPLAADIEITGHAMVELYLRSSTPDGAVFAYLEDVRPDGMATQITDGQLRFIHRKQVVGPIHYADAVPQHSFTRADAQPMDTTSVQKVAFDLMPTSFLVKAGHRIRLRLAGTDNRYFKLMYPQGGRWDIRCTATYPSRVILPAVGHAPTTGQR